MTEIANNIHGDLLSENPDVARSCLGAHRVMAGRWKGMSPQQVQQVLDTRERQKQEKQVCVQLAYRQEGGYGHGLLSLT